MRMFGIIFAILFSRRMFYFGYSLFYENGLYLFLYFHYIFSMLSLVFFSISVDPLC